MSTIKETIKNRVDTIANESKVKILELINAQLLTEEIIDEKNNTCQLEIIVSWDDEKKGIVRIATFLSRPTDKWWKSFFSSSSDERLIDINTLD